MTARRKVYVSLPARLLDRIEQERATAEQRDHTPVSSDDVIEALLTIGLEFAGDEA